PARVVIEPAGDVEGLDVQGELRTVPAAEPVEVQLVQPVGLGVVVGVAVVEEQVTKDDDRQAGGWHVLRPGGPQLVEGIEDGWWRLPLAVDLLGRWGAVGVFAEEVLLAVEFDVPGGLGGPEPGLRLSHRVNLP